MNRMQKIAWVNLIGCFLVAMQIGFLAYLMLTPSKVKYLKAAAVLLPGILVLFIGYFCFILRKKQSPAEPDVDERDKLISIKAAQVALISLCILLYIATAIPILMFGIDGSLPLYMLPLINVSIFMIALTIYNATILILYGRGNKWETRH